MPKALGGKGAGSRKQDLNLAAVSSNLFPHMIISHQKTFIKT